MELVWLGRSKYFGVFVCTAIERLVLPKSEVHATEAEPLLLGEVDVDSHGILALVLRCCAVKNQFWLP